MFHRRSIVALLVAVLSTLYSVLGTSSAAADPQTSPDYSQTSWHRQLVALHNAERAKVGAAPLSAHALLAQAAQAHANHMAKTGQFAHAGIGNGDVLSRIEATGYQGKRWGENIAWGAESAAKAQDIWMNSPPHREQLLTKEYREVGFGACKSADGKIYWVACFGAPP